GDGTVAVAAAVATSGGAAGGGRIGDGGGWRRGGGHGGGKWGGSRRLWQCTWCCVAFCINHLPPQLATAGRKARVADANQCVHCRSPSPRVKLALLLEGICSRLANHHLAIPFLRPFMPGIASPFDVDDDHVDGDLKQLSSLDAPVTSGTPPGEEASATRAAGEAMVVERAASSHGPVVTDLSTESAASGAGATAAGASPPDGAGKKVVVDSRSTTTATAASAGHPSVRRRVRGRECSNGGGCGAEVTPADVPVEDIMGLLEKTRALGYTRSAELMADVRNLQGKCRKAVRDWGGGDPETGGGFGAGSGRMVVRAMDTLAATMEGLLARSREELAIVEGEISKKSEQEHRRQTDRGVGDGSANGGFPWRGEFLPPMQRPSPAAAATAKAKAAAAAAAAAAAVVANGRRARGSAASRAAVGARDAKSDAVAAVSAVDADAAHARRRHPPLRLTRRWSLAKWSEFLQNAPILRRSTGHAVPGETITVNGTEVLGTQQLRESLAEGMRSPAVLPNPDDDDDSDGYYFSESDCEISAVPTRIYGRSGVRASGGDADEAGDEGPMAPVPEWSELETAVQALMGMDGGVEECEDGWDATESARLVQMESVLEEQRKLMRRMMRHNGQLRALWKKYAASPLEDRGAQGAEGVVTLGETSVLTEFQISNDLLRQRVQDLEGQLRAQSERNEGCFPPAAPAATAGNFSPTGAVTMGNGMLVTSSAVPIALQGGGGGAVSVPGSIVADGNSNGIQGGRSATGGASGGGGGGRNSPE
ncbi:unnamed protein product, partial [Scytosiphon promiscuus]